MSRGKKQYEDDDGRTVADMSDLPDVSSSWLGRPSGGKAKRRETGEQKPSDLSKEERRWAVLGGMSAALLIGLVFVAGLGLVILLLLLVWNLGGG